MWCLKLRMSVQNGVHRGHYEGSASMHIDASRYQSRSSARLSCRVSSHVVWVPPGSFGVECPSIRTPADLSSHPERTISSPERLPMTRCAQDLSTMRKRTTKILRHP